MSWIVLGVAIMIVSQTATLAGIEPFASWNTPIAWTGFILFADSIVFRARRRSWIRSAPLEFVLLALASIPFWIVFEGFNLVIRNWYYTGLPENFWLRQFGFAWAYATIWPAIFEGAQLIAVARETARGRDGTDRTGGRDGTDGTDGRDRTDGRERRDGRDGRDGIERSGGTERLVGTDGFRRRGPLWGVGLGVIMLASPFAVSPDVARYLAAPVWLGFIFLLDPINRRLGAPSLAEDLERGAPARLVNLMASGLLCGGLWELWNYWARAKWHYTVPIMESLKIFEMPLPGYFGFPAFALECFTMYVFVRRLLGPKLDWTIAL